MHSEPENKILRSIRPSLLRNSSNPEGPETTASLLTNSAKVKSVEAGNNQNSTVVSGEVPSVTQLPKATFAQKIHAASSSRTTPIIASQYPVQQGMSDLHGAHLHDIQNYGSRIRGFSETGNSRPHGSLIETTGVQTTRHSDRPKMGAYEAAGRRLSGIAPPPPSHLVEPFPPFVPYVQSNQQINTNDMYGVPRPVMNPGFQGPSFEDRQYRGFGFLENGLVLQGQPQRPTNSSFSLSNNCPPGPALSVSKTRNLQSQINAPRVLPTDSLHGPPIAIQRPPTGQLVTQPMPHSSLMPFSNDARVIHDAHIAAANQRIWQQQMHEQARSNEVQSGNRLEENNRPAERGDRRFLHKRGRGGYPRHRSSPTKHKSDQLDMHHRESGISSQSEGDFAVSLPHQVVSESVPEHHGMTSQGYGAQRQRYTWKQYGNSIPAESPKAVSSSDERPFVMTEQSSWHSPHNLHSSRNHTWVGPRNQWSDEDTEPDKLYISGDGLEETDVRHLVEPLAKITEIRAGSRWKYPEGKPYYFVRYGFHMLFHFGYEC